MPPQANISHQTTRRLRLRIPRRKRNVAYFARVRDELSHCEGVERVEANPHTGSVLIHHRSTPEAIARFAEEHHLFAVAPTALTPGRSLAAKVNEGAKILDSRLDGITAGRVDLTSMSIVGLVVLGIFQGVRRGFLPAGGNLIWWAITLLLAYKKGAVPSSSDLGRE